MRKWVTFEEWLAAQANSRRSGRIGEIAEHWDWRTKTFHNPEWIRAPRSQAWLDEALAYARNEWSREYYGAIQSFVYLIQAGEFIKIGVTADPDSRVAELQTGNPQKLIMIALFAGDAAAERRLHTRFQDYRLEGEWFKVEPVLAWLETFLS